MPKLLLAAGGTGGHMFPAQALAENLKADGWTIALMTDGRGQRHAGRIPADPIIEVQAASISPRRPVEALAGVLKLSRGVKAAKAFIKDWNPDLVVGFGGYPAFPAMRAAQVLGLPTIIHEQNAVLGRVNGVFAAKADYVCSGFEKLDRLPKGSQHIVTGNPLRDQIIASIPKTYALPDKTINILIVGGSLGARLIGEVVPKAMSLLPDDIKDKLWIVQQTREENLETARAEYAEAGIQAECAPFFSNIQTHLAAAHFVIGRAGASTVSEIAAMGKPSLLVPLAIAMDDHQTANAEALKRLEAADILPESMFTPENVKTSLERRLNDSKWLAQASQSARSAARPDATRDLADLVRSCISAS